MVNLRQFRLIRSLPIVVVLISASLLARAADAEKPPVSVPATAPNKPLPLVERKRALEALRKEIEAAQPDPTASNEEKSAYLELAMDGFGKFAKQNPGTLEAFDAVATLTMVLAQNKHVRATEFAELAANSAPDGGADNRKLAYCWAIAASGKLNKGDLEGGKKALENIKAIDEQIYTQMMQQVKIFEERMRVRAQTPDPAAAPADNTNRQDK